MLLFDDALKKAKEVKSVINECHEYDEGYHFIDKNFDGDGDNGVVIVKETGEAITWIAFIMRYHPSPKYKKCDWSE